MLHVIVFGAVKPERLHERDMEWRQINACKVGQSMLRRMAVIPWGVYTLWLVSPYRVWREWGLPLIEELARNLWRLLHSPKFWRPVHLEGWPWLGAEGTGARDAGKYGGPVSALGWSWHDMSQGSGHVNHATSWSLSSGSVDCMHAHKNCNCRYWRWRNICNRISKFMV